jgi:hypothetical protein
MEIIVKDVTLLRADAQSEVFLADDSSPASVIGELRQLSGNLKRAAEEVARINKYQKLFKVLTKSVCLLCFHCSTSKAVMLSFLLVIGSFT